MTRKNRIFTFGLVFLIITGAIMYLLLDGYFSFPADPRGRNRLPIDPTGQLILIVGLFVVLLYPVKILARSKDAGWAKAMLRWLKKVHPYLGILAVYITVIHFGLFLVSGRPWSGEAYTGLAAMMIGALIGTGGLCKYMKLGKGFARVERQFHKWGTLVMLAVVLLLHMK